MAEIFFNLHYFTFYIIISLVIFMKLFKKIKFKPLCISLGMIILQTIFYYLAKLLQGEAHLIEWTIDYEDRTKADEERLLKKYKKVNVHILRTRAEVNNYLLSLIK